MSWLLILATLIGAFTAADDVCFDSHQAQIATFHSAGEPSTDSHSTASSFHSCHLGHCVFLVSTVSDGLLAPTKEIRPSAYLATISSCDQPGPFRPPIA